MSWDNAVDTQLKDVIQDLIESLDFENKGQKDKAREKIDKAKGRLGIA